MSENITSAIRIQLKDRLKAEGIKYENLSLKMDSYNMHISQVMSPKMHPNPKLSTLAKIADAAGLEIRFSIVKKQEK